MPLTPTHRVVHRAKAEAAGAPTRVAPETLDAVPEGTLAHAVRAVRLACRAAILPLCLVYFDALRGKLPARGDVVAPSAQAFMTGVQQQLIDMERDAHTQAQTLVDHFVREASAARSVLEAVARGVFGGMMADTHHTLLQVRFRRG